MLSGPGKEWGWMGRALSGWGNLMMATQACLILGSFVCTLNIKIVKKNCCQVVSLERLSSPCMSQFPHLSLKRKRGCGGQGSQPVPAHSYSRTLSTSLA